MGRPAARWPGGSPSTRWIIAAAAGPSGERFFVRSSVDEYVDDLATFIDAVKTREPGLPVFLLGHSAGGVIACVYALEHQDELAGLICESFAYQVPAPDFALPMLKGLSHVAPHAHVLKLKNEDFSRDPAGRGGDERRPADRQRVAADARRSPRWCAPTSGSRRASRRSRCRCSSCTAPPTRRRSRAAARQFYEQAGSDDKTLKLYEGHFHDLLADVGKEQVMADIQAWIDAHLPPTPIRRVEEIRV